MLVGATSATWAGPAEEIAEIERQQAQAFSQGDLDAWLAAVADDAVLTSSVVPFRIEGKEAIRAHYAGFFQVYPTRRLINRQRSIRFYNDDTAAVTNAYLHLTAVDRNGQANTFYLRSSITWVKQGGRWLVVDAHVSRLPVSP